MHYSFKYKVASAAIAVTLLAGGFAIAPAPSTYAAEVTAVNQIAKVTWGVNLRKGPSSSYAKIRTISKGETVTVTGFASNGWLKVKDSKGNAGYISNDSKYTEVVSSSGSSGSSNSSGSSVSSSSSVEKVISTGMKYLGTPYEYGSDRNTTKTFDCSDFVRHSFKEALGITLPGDSRKQGAYVKERGNAKTSISSLKRGDLMFFMSYKGSSKSSYSGINKSKQRITHVGIYLGNGKILHTYSKESGGVRVDTITGKHWEYRFLYGGSALK